MQSLVWSIGYGALALLVLGCGLLMPRGAAVAVAASIVPKPATREILRWIVLSAIPSGLMLSTTLYLTTDIVAMPLLWVLPLGLYLLSFSVAFASRRGPADAIIRMAPFALLIAACIVFSDTVPFALAIAGLALASMFAVAVALHSMLFDQRPDAAHLTIFYLSTSVGGVLGGLICALIAPLIFDWTYEYPLLLLAAAATLAAVNPFERLAAMWNGSLGAARWSRWLIAAALSLSLLGVGTFESPAHRAIALVGAMLVIALGICAIGNRALFTACVAALMLNLGGWEKMELSRSNQMTRSFFGIDTVRPLSDNALSLVHGTTVHGVELMGSVARERTTTTYYAPRSGVGLAMAAVPSIFRNARVGVVGLGAGTLACTSTPEQSWRFYEIDPKVAGIARRDFHFLSRCQPNAPILIGDARLTLEREPLSSADVLVIDAFSSDSVPMHLLTLEAFDVYRQHLSPEGLLMVHISNRYLDLRPVVAAAAAHGWTARVRTFQPTAAEIKLHASPSMWIALSPSAKTMAGVERSSGQEQWLPLVAGQTKAWTDDHASILPLIQWRG
jgi:spermidine synthase